MIRIIGAAAGVAMFTAGSASAACSTDKDAYDLTSDEAQASYACLEAEMHAGYVKGPKRWIDAGVVEGYRGWRLASTAPAAPGFHSERFLVTWVNGVGYDAYTEFKDEGAKMPAGTIIAKESFQVSEAGAASAGP